MNYLCSLLLCACFNFSHAQVYPYEYQPDRDSSKSKKYGLVNSNNEKITEPIYGLIDPFLNQEYNDYTLYYTNQPNPPGSEYPYHSIKGLIDKTGKVVDGVSDQHLVYDGNGRIAFVAGDSLDTYYNLKTHKHFIRDRQEQINHTARGTTYYLLMFHLEHKIYTVINEHGTAWPVVTKPYQEVEYIKMLNGLPVYKVKGLNNTALYYYGDGREADVKKIYPQEDYWGIDEAIPEPTTDLIDFSPYSSITVLSEQIKQRILGIYPDHSIGKPLFVKNGGIKYVEIRNKYDKVGLVDLDGQLILECDYTKITHLMSDFNDDQKDDKFYATFFDYSKSGLMNMNGEILFKPNFGFIQFNEQVNLFSLLGPNGYAGFCDWQGKIFLPKECECLDE